MRGNASEAEALKRQRYQWLLETGQEEEAGRVKERDGDFVGAINLFMQGGLPARAAQVLALPLYGSALSVCLAYLVLPCPALPCPALPCPALPCPALPSLS